MERLVDYSSSDDEIDPAASRIAQPPQGNHSLPSVKGKEVMNPRSSAGTSTRATPLSRCFSGLNPLDCSSSSSSASPRTILLYEGREEQEPIDTSILFHMGFSQSAVHEALQNYGEGTPIETLINYLTNSCPSPKKGAESDNLEVLLGFGFLYDDATAAINTCGEDAELGVLIQYIHDHQKQQQNKSTVKILQDLGYAERRAKEAVAACGGDTEISILVDFMDAHEMGEEQNYVSDDYIEGDNPNVENMQPLKLPRKRTAPKSLVKKEPKAFRSIHETSRGDMTGFGIPGVPKISRTLTARQRRRPYFYFENVSTMPTGEWDEIIRNLDDIVPEFVDSRHFCVARRARGYIHNLPTEHRFQQLPAPPKTIREFLPHTVPFTPSWDTREKLNCVNTVRCPTTFSKRIETYLQGGPTEDQRKEIMQLCRTWNLVWTAPRVCSPLEPHENEMVLGYPTFHTRGGTSMTQRNQSLGNAFQVDTVAYHLSVLKREFPEGIRVLSLFSGIGGAEVALNKVGIPLNFVVSVEIKPENRMILQRWWHTTNQTGTHHVLEDVRGLDRRTLESLIEESGGFDLIIGGSPCNNLTGNNRNTRTGLEGEHSILFYEFPRILADVRSIMGIN